MADDDLKKRITGRIRAPFDGVGKLEVILDQDGKAETLRVDDDWLNKERKRIENEYTFQINNFGRVILYSDRATFDKAEARFRSIVEKYQATLRDKLAQSQEHFQKRNVNEFAGRWQKNPPAYFARCRTEPTPDKITAELERLAKEIFDSAVSFDPPVVKILYKNVAPENLRESVFLEVLKTIMLKRRVPPEIIDSLFESGLVAPETGAFLGR